MTDMHRVRTAVYSASISELPGAGASDHRFSAPGAGSGASTVVFVGDVLRPAEFGHVPGIGPITQQTASPDGTVHGRSGLGPLGGAAVSPRCAAEPLTWWATASVRRSRGRRHR